MSQLWYSTTDNKKYRYSTRGAMMAETDKSPDPLNLIWIIPA